MLNFVIEKVQPPYLTKQFDFVTNRFETFGWTQLIKNKTVCAEHHGELFEGVNSFLGYKLLF